MSVYKGTIIAFLCLTKNFTIMNQNQFDKLKMFRVVLAVCLKYLKLVESVPAFLRAYQALTKLVIAVEKDHTVQGANTKGVTVNKEQMRDAVIDSAMYIAGAVHSHASDIENSELMAKVHVNISDFKNCGFEECIKKCDIIAKEASVVMDQLADHGVVQKDLDGFMTLVNDFKIMITKPREVIVEKSSVTIDIADLFSTGDKILKEKMDKLINKYKPSDPSFYQEYWNARIIEGGGHHPGKNGNENPHNAGTK